MTNNDNKVIVNDSTYDEIDTVRELANRIENIADGGDTRIRSVSITLNPDSVFVRVTMTKSRYISTKGL